MASDVLYAKILSRYIYDKFKEVVTFEDILSLTTPISDHQEDLVNRSQPFLSTLEKSLTIFDKSLTPNGIYATCKDWLKKFGEFRQIDEHREEYYDNNPEMYKVVLLDHVG